MDEQILNKINEFFSRFKHQSYKKGEILIRADDDPAGIFYLKEGFVRQYAISHKGEEVVLNIFKPPAFFPMSWAINNTPNNYFYEAMTNLDIWRAPRDEVIKFIRSNPDVLYDLMSRVYKGTEGMLARMTYLMAGSAYERLVTELLIYGKRFGKGESRVELSISEKDLAALTGLTRETISREIKTLKDKGLITHTVHSFVIEDLQKLIQEMT